MFETLPPHPRGVRIGSRYTRQDNGCAASNDNLQGSKLAGGLVITSIEVRKQQLQYPFKRNSMYDLFSTLLHTNGAL